MTDQWLSPHLAWRELACHDAIRTPYPLDWRPERALRLAAVFEAIRTACGDQPIVVLSAYRTVEHNRKVGGARASQHVEGRALDLRPPAGLSAQAFFERIKALATNVGDLKGIGLYSTFVHVDVRPALDLVVFHGDRPAAEVRTV